MWIPDGCLFFLGTFQETAKLAVYKVLLAICSALAFLFTFAYLSVPILKYRIDLQKQIVALEKEKDKIKKEYKGCKDEVGKKQCKDKIDKIDTNIKALNDKKKNYEKK